MILALGWQAITTIVRKLLVSVVLDHFGLLRTSRP
jgi:hypothetical protein